MALARSEDIKTPLMRLAFAPGLFKLRKDKKGVEKDWGCTLLISKGEDLSALKNLAAETAIAAWGDKAAKMVAEELIKTPFLDGDGKQGKSKKTGEPHAGFSGCTFIRVSSGKDYRPKTLNKKLLPVTNAAELYSGCYVYAVVNAFAWENEEQGKGISFGVSVVQFVKDGEKLGGDAGGVDPEAFLDVIPDEGDAPAATKTGKGAAGLFN